MGITLIIKRAILYEVVGDESLGDWNYQSRTLSSLNEDGSYRFSQLPSVMRFDRLPQPNSNDYRVDETPLRAQYIRINNYDGDGVRRCENYLWKDDTALYNNTGFPRRQYLTMSRNLLKFIQWEENETGKYLKFETLKPTDDVSRMTYFLYPWFIHVFDLVGHTRDKQTYHTYNTPRGLVYFFLTSREGYGYIPENYVRKA